MPLPSIACATTNKRAHARWVQYCTRLRRPPPARDLPPRRCLRPPPAPWCMTRARRLTYLRTKINLTLPAVQYAPQPAREPTRARKRAPHPAGSPAPAALPTRPATRAAARPPSGGTARAGPCRRCLFSSPDPLTRACHDVTVKRTAHAAASRCAVLQANVAPAFYLPTVVSSASSGAARAREQTVCAIPYSRATDRARTHAASRVGMARRCRGGATSPVGRQRVHGTCAADVCQRAAAATMLR